MTRANDAPCQVLKLRRNVISALWALNTIRFALQNRSVNSTKQNPDDDRSFNTKKTEIFLSKIMRFPIFSCYNGSMTRSRVIGLKEKTKSIFLCFNSSYYVFI